MMFRTKKMQDRIKQLDDDSKQELIDALSTISNEKFRVDKLYSELLKSQSTEEFFINLFILEQDTVISAEAIELKLSHITYHEIVEQIRKIDNLNNLLKLKATIETYLENDKKWDVLKSIKRIIEKSVEYGIIFFVFEASLIYFIIFKKDLNFNNFIWAPLVALVVEIVAFLWSRNTYSHYKVNGKTKFLLLQIEKRQKELESESSHKKNTEIETSK